MRARKGSPCQVCGEYKLKLQTIKDYKSTRVAVCDKCAESMKMTLMCMRVSADWYLEKRGLAKMEKTDRVGVLRQIKSKG